MNYGLSPRDLQTLYQILGKYPEVKEVYLFGSRAKGNYHAGSDIDIAVMDELIQDKVIQRLRTDFEESSLPYFVEVVNYSKLPPGDLKDLISGSGKRIYKREDEPASVNDPETNYNSDQSRR